MSETQLIRISGTEYENRIADIVFVHGLGGNALSTWHPQGLILWELTEYKLTAETFEFYQRRPIFVLIYGLVSGGISGLFFGIILGLNLNVEIKYREKPNQGIKESFKKTLIIFLVSSPFGMIILPLTSLLIDAPLL